MKKLKEMEQEKLSEVKKRSGKGRKVKMGLNLSLQPELDSDDEEF